MKDGKVTFINLFIFSYTEKKLNLVANLNQLTFVKQNPTMGKYKFFPNVNVIKAFYYNKKNESILPICFR